MLALSDKMLRDRVVVDDILACARVKQDLVCCSGNSIGGLIIRTFRLRWKRPMAFPRGLLVRQ